MDVLDLTEMPIEQFEAKIKYAATPEEHAANVKAAVALGLPSLVRGPITSEPIAVVCYGPSLKQTRREIRYFNKILTCSGAHDYLIRYGIVPTWHMEGDPRKHKAVFVKHPHKRVTYLISSACHPAMFEALKGQKVLVWHVLKSDLDLLETGHYPKGQWVLTGGTNVGMRAMVMARLLGYTNIHVFGMDCSAGSTMHVDDHPNEVPEEKYRTVVVDGEEFRTTTLFLSYAKNFFHEVLQLADCEVKLHGHGLLQALVKKKTSDPLQLTDWMEQRANIAETVIAVVET